MNNINRAALEAAYQSADVAFKVAAGALTAAETRARRSRSAANVAAFVAAEAAFGVALEAVTAAEAALVAAIELEAAAALEAARVPDFVNLAFTF